MWTSHAWRACSRKLFKKKTTKKSRNARNAKEKQVKKIAPPVITDPSRFMQRFNELSADLRNDIFALILPTKDDSSCTTPAGVATALKPPATLEAIDAAENPIPEFELFQEQAFHFWLSTRKLTNWSGFDGWLSSNPWVETMSTLQGMIEWLRHMHMFAASIHDLALNPGPLQCLNDKLWELAKVVYDMPEILQPGKLQFVHWKTEDPAACQNWDRRALKAIEIGRKASLEGLGMHGLEDAWMKWEEKEFLVLEKQLKKKKPRKKKKAAKEAAKKPANNATLTTKQPTKACPLQAQPMGKAATTHPSPRGKIRKPVLNTGIADRLRSRQKKTEG
ncbi:hypothetical protein MBLNU459_g5740t1 [Dothideomycetes sp. NU459]